MYHQPDSDFGSREIPLVPGALYGSRAFHVGGDGKLRPLFAGTGPFKPGINVAECWCANGVFNHTFWMTTSYGGSTYHDSICTHKAPDIDCSCGFYAYFDNAQENAHMMRMSGRVTGIVRATGRCIVGSLGFRAEKVEIVALVGELPEEEDEVVRTRRQRLKAWYRAFAIRHNQRLFDHVYTPLNLLLYATAIILLNVIGYVIGGSVQTAVVILIAALTATMLVSSVIGSMGSYWKHSDKLDEIHKSVFGDPHEYTRLIAKQYPDVLFFKTLEEAYRHFPPTKVSELPQ